MPRVAITGFGVVSPVGSGRERFFSSLARGASGIGPITRFEAGTFQARMAGEVKDFVPPAATESAAAARDPKVGFALAAAAEALAQAGLERLGPGVLLHLGSSLEVIDPDQGPIDPGAEPAALVGRIDRAAGIPFRTTLDLVPRILAERYGRPGLALTNCSACAAGTQALGHGFRAVRSGRFHAAVCGGFDSLIFPMGVGGFQLLGALTTDNQKGERACRPFDADRKGTVLGEGAAVFVLEPLDRARAEGKTVLAEICGYGSTLDAHNLSAPDPEGDGAARAMLRALADAGVAPEEVGHINAHGTGTHLNDEVEAAAIRRVFRGSWERIPVSATKSMTGHLIGAAGPVELGACLLALFRGILPPNPSLAKVGRGCELNHVTAPSAGWGGEVVLSNSFGFGGQNGVLVARRADG